MDDLVASSSRFPAPPWRALRDRLSARAEELAEAGDVTGAAVLRALLESWGREQRSWEDAARDVLRAHHEINNALVGVSGNAQLLLLSPAGQMPKVRERLEMVLRESERIGRASRQLQLLKTSLSPESHGLDASNAA
jgi:signal transduction histidine kinase